MEPDPLARPPRAPQRGGRIQAGGGGIPLGRGPQLKNHPPAISVSLYTCVVHVVIVTTTIKTGLYPSAYHVV